MTEFNLHFTIFILPFFLVFLRIVAVEPFPSLGWYMFAVVMADYDFYTILSGHPLMDVDGTAEHLAILLVPRAIIASWVIF